MNILVDMNLSPNWCAALANHGHNAAHWSKIGATTAPDTELMAYARDNGFVVCKHDLDFGAILAATKADGPSVLQLRTQDILPDTASSIVVDALTQFTVELASGTLVTIDTVRARVRILPV